jgi:hypothetical protein
LITTTSLRNCADSSRNAQDLDSVSECAARLPCRDIQLVPVAVLVRLGASGDASAMTIEKTTIEKTLPGQLATSDTLLKGADTLDLYLPEIAGRVVALTEQSALLLQALAERLKLLRAIEAGKAAIPAAGQDP